MSRLSLTVVLHYYVDAKIVALKHTAAEYKLASYSDLTLPHPKNKHKMLMRDNVDDVGHTKKTTVIDVNRYMWKYKLFVFIKAKKTKNMSTTQKFQRCARIKTESKNADAAERNWRKLV